MTGLADIRCADVRWAFAHCSCAVMTTGTSARDMGVINCAGCDWSPGVSRMTGSADIGRRNMRCPFAGGMHVVMASLARLSCCRNVIKVRYQPIRHRMATITSQHRRYVIYPFTLRHHTIVTTLAGTDDFIMIYCARSHGCPQCWTNSMAGITDIGGRHMTGTLATGNAAIMAGYATADHLCVIHCAICNG